MESHESVSAFPLPKVSFERKSSVVESYIVYIVFSKSTELHITKAKIFTRMFLGGVKEREREIESESN